MQNFYARLRVITRYRVRINICFTILPILESPRAQKPILKAANLVLDLAQLQPALEPVGPGAKDPVDQLRLGVLLELLFLECLFTTIQRVHAHWVHTSLEQTSTIVLLRQSPFSPLLFVVHEFEMPCWVALWNSIKVSEDQKT